MKIVHLNSYDIKGGAARATYRLHTGLRQQGCDSSMMVAHRSSSDPSVLAFYPPMDLTSRLWRRFRQQRISHSFFKFVANRPRGFEKFSDDRSCYGTSLAKELPSCDIVNLHWIADFVDYQAFFSTVPEHIPIFWRLSDMNALTGGCHFDDGCGGHAAGCGACPQIGSTDSRDLSYQIWLRKQTVFNRLSPKRLHIIALNRWMAELVKQSPLLGKFAVTIVPNGIDTNVFAPRDVHVARQVLGIPEQGRVVLFASDVVTNRRKGFALLAAALHELHTMDNLFLLSVGGGTPKIEAAIPYLHLGHIDDDRLLALVYAAADTYVIPSLQDNQPNTVLEAMACGTPVVGFDVGGIPDMVRPGVTGLLTPAGDVRGLSAAIAKILESHQMRKEMGETCRRVVTAEYTLETQVRHYIELYTAALERVSPKILDGSRKVPGAPSIEVPKGFLVDNVATPGGVTPQ